MFVELFQVTTFTLYATTENFYVNPLALAFY